jgi:hypothetical protein
MRQPIPPPDTRPAAQPATRQLLLSVWAPRPGGFAARAVLADGSLRDFDNPFELVRFLSAPSPPAGPSRPGQGGGLR